MLVDNLDNSSMQVVEGVRQLCNDAIPFFQMDIRSADKLSLIFDELQDGGAPVQGILHFAAHKAVGESVHQPAKYASNNIGGLGTLLEVAAAHEVRNIVFSSSCTVYGNPEHVPVAEDANFQDASSPYGWTKQASERVLTDHAATHPKHRVALLRYFNPIGAHPSACIGELPLGVPNNLVPFLTQTVAGIRNELTVFGGDYPTNDGTCVRDYLHVMDLAEAACGGVAMVLDNEDDAHVVRAFNLGTGQGASVLEVIHAFERATGQAVPYHIGERRDGDVVAIWADPSRAQAELKWQPRAAWRRRWQMPGAGNRPFKTT